MKNWLSPEGPFFSFIDKLGQLVLLSILWMLGCLPVVTIAASTAALYYAVMKSIRRGRGDAVKEFWHSYKANLRRSIPITLAGLLLGAVMGFNVSISAQSGGALFWGNVLGLVLLAMVGCYLFPVMSRFDMKAGKVWKLSFVMALGFLPITLALVLGTGALVLLQIYVLPMPTAVLLPGIWCFAASFLTEKVLRRYMPEKTPENDDWYYE